MHGKVYMMRWSFSYFLLRSQDIPHFHISEKQLWPNPWEIEIVNSFRCKIFWKRFSWIWLKWRPPASSGRLLALWLAHVGTATYKNWKSGIFFKNWISRFFFIFEPRQRETTTLSSLVRQITLKKKGNLSRWMYDISLVLKYLKPPVFGRRFNFYFACLCFYSAVKWCLIKHFMGGLTMMDQISLEVFSAWMLLYYWLYDPISQI